MKFNQEKWTLRGNKIARYLVTRSVGVRFRPALVRYDGFSLFAARDPNIVLSSRFIQAAPLA